MKGPYERLKYDLTRVWECPECHHRDRTDGSVVTKFCGCLQRAKSGGEVSMKLVEDGARLAVRSCTSEVKPKPAAKGAKRRRSHG